jgi:hypothetical protein
LGLHFPGATDRQTSEEAGGFLEFKLYPALAAMFYVTRAVGAKTQTH